MDVFPLPEAPMRRTWRYLLALALDVGEFVQSQTFFFMAVNG